MGNDSSSHMSGLDVEEKAVEVNEHWAHHTATINSGCTAVSVFIGEPLVSGSLWMAQTPLEKASKNLMIYRHPCILKYISSWNRSSKYYLAVEDVKPLAHVLTSLTSLQICVGLHSILKGLVFLHEKANASHNNVCIASIYVTKEGAWKLGGTEYLRKYDDITADYLNKSRMHRYSKSVDPNEEKYVKQHEGVVDFIDIYAFSVLALEIFKRNGDDNLSTLPAFLDYCKTDLQNVDVTKRPKLATLLQHPFFNQEFITLHSFLTELPLKNDLERTEFFDGLIAKLKMFDEVNVASQLGGLLLSRMVLLNKTAQTALIPYVLTPKHEIEAISDCNLFSLDTFRKYIVPKLLEIFCVRDAQIRLLLLEYFSHFMKAFTKEQLQLNILPELLVGIKDTNDQLVAVTLRSLADLIPLLGAATVIGGKRAKLFNDGRPTPMNACCKTRRKHSNKQLRETTPINIETDVLSNSSELPERPSPDGEEGETSTDEIEVENVGDEETWDDWDINQDSEEVMNRGDNSTENTAPSLQELSLAPVMPDILQLDIKNQRNSLGGKLDEEFNYFEDMEPIIETSRKYLINNDDDDEESSKEKVVALNLGVLNADHHEEGWGEDLDWED